MLTYSWLKSQPHAVACASPILISAIAVTEERNNVIDYTIPYLSAKVTYSYEESTDTSIEEYAMIPLKF